MYRIYWIIFAGFNGCNFKTTWLYLIEYKAYRTVVLRQSLPNIFHYIEVKVKFTRHRPGVAQRVGRGIALLFLDRGTRRGEWSAARPGRTLPPGKNRYPFYRRLGGPQGRSGRAENLVTTGIWSRTVQPFPLLYGGNCIKCLRSRREVILHLTF